MLKIFIVTTLLTLAIVVLILSLDIFLGFNPSQLFGKLKKPYEVPEASEYLVVIGFISFFTIKFVIGFLKRKYGNNPSAN